MQVAQIIHPISDLIVDVSQPKCTFDRFSGVEDYDADSLVFLFNVEQLHSLKNTPPKVIVTDEQTASQLEPKDFTCLILVSHVRLAQAKLLQAYNDYDASDAEWSSIHPSAVIHASSTIGVGVRIGANTVIGANVRLGEHSQVRANCVIEHDVEVGANCVINNLVNIGYGCRLGDRVILRSGVIIGSEGFGLAQDEDRRYHRIPHNGWVEIEDDVSIGANCTVDRGTFGATHIGRGVKIDALCHIAHNVDVGEDSILVAQTGLAGSSRIGKRVIASGQTGVLDHMKVADDAILVHRCGVSEDIPSAGVWAGTPPKKLKEYVRNLNLNKKLEKLEQKVKELSKQLKD